MVYIIRHICHMYYARVPFPDEATILKSGLFILRRATNRDETVSYIIVFRKNFPAHLY